MTQSARQNREYSFQKRLWRELNERYHATGAFWQNTTYSHGNHHDPFPTIGAGDLIGCLKGRWVEIELKTSVGRWRDMQRVRKSLVERIGGIYLVVREGEESEMFRRLDELTGAGDV